MDKTQKFIYQTLSRHLLQAAEELRFSDLFEEQEYYLLALKETWVILQQKNTTPAKKVRLAKIAIQSLCPNVAEDMEGLVSALDIDISLE